jgi:hypothetical protein
MKWEKQTLALAICVVFLVAMTGVTIAATGAEISGEPDFTKVVKQPLSESIVNPEASTVLVAVAANDYSNTLEHDALVSTLNSLGYNTIDVTTVAEAQAAGADVIFAYVGCYYRYGYHYRSVSPNSSRSSCILVRARILGVRLSK